MVPTLQTCDDAWPCRTMKCASPVRYSLDASIQQQVYLNSLLSFIHIRRYCIFLYLRIYIKKKRNGHPSFIVLRSYIILCFLLCNNNTCCVCFCFCCCPYTYKAKRVALYASYKGGAHHWCSGACVAAASAAIINHWSRSVQAAAATSVALVVVATLLHHHALKYTADAELCTSVLAASYYFHSSVTLRVCIVLRCWWRNESSYSPQQQRQQPQQKGTRIYTEHWTLNTGWMDDEHSSSRLPFIFIPIPIPILLLLLVYITVICVHYYDTVFDITLIQWRPPAVVDST